MPDFRVQGLQGLGSGTSGFRVDKSLRAPDAQDAVFLDSIVCQRRHNVLDDCVRGQPVRPGGAVSAPVHSRGLQRAT